MWQALRGQSVMNPDAATLVALTSWIVLSTVGHLDRRLSGRNRTRTGTGVLKMTPNQIFSIANFVALCGWLLLAFLPGRKWASEHRRGSWRFLPYSLRSIP